jgi:hypothetical protein
MGRLRLRPLPFVPRWRRRRQTGQAEEPAKPTLPESVAGIEAISWQDMQSSQQPCSVDELFDPAA